VAVVARLVQKYERDSTQGETIYKIQKHRILKIENKKYKTKNKHKKNIKNISRAIRK